MGGLNKGYRFYRDPGEIYKGYGIKAFDIRPLHGNSPVADPLSGGVFLMVSTSKAFTTGPTLDL